MLPYQQILHDVTQFDPELKKLIKFKLNTQEITDVEYTETPKAQPQQGLSGISEPTSGEVLHEGRTGDVYPGSTSETNSIES